MKLCALDLAMVDHPLCHVFQHKLSFHIYLFTGDFIHPWGMVGYFFNSPQKTKLDRTLRNQLQICNSFEIQSIGIRGEVCDSYEVGRFVAIL